MVAILRHARRATSFGKGGLFYVFFHKRSCQRQLTEDLTACLPSRIKHVNNVTGGHTPFGAQAETRLNANKKQKEQPPDLSDG